MQMFYLNFIWTDAVKPRARVTQGEPAAAGTRYRKRYWVSLEHYSQHPGQFTAPVTDLLVGTLSDNSYSYKGPPIDDLGEAPQGSQLPSEVGVIQGVHCLLASSVALAIAYVLYISSQDEGE